MVAVKTNGSLLGVTTLSPKETEDKSGKEIVAPLRSELRSFSKPLRAVGRPVGTDRGIVGIRVRRLPSDGRSLSNGFNGFRLTGPWSRPMPKRCGSWV